MLRFTKGLLLAAVALMLTACGGGGGGGGGFTVADSLNVNISVSKSEMPFNPNGLAPALGSPYTAQIIVSVRRKDGASADTGTLVHLAVDGVDYGTLSTPDKPDTEVNEFLQRMGLTFSEVGAGQAMFFFTSEPTVGTATLTASVQDPASNRTVSASTQIRVVGGSGMPSDIVRGVSEPLYRDSQSPTQVALLDSANQRVPDPTASNVNNLRIDILSAPAGAYLSGVNALLGQNQVGNAISVRTVQGIGQFTVHSGSEPGLVLFRVTADRWDNNIDNGVEDAISRYFIAQIVTGTQGAAALDMVTSSLPNGKAGQFYVALLEASGGTQPYTWSIPWGSLPPGLTLDPNGVISGTPTKAGAYQFILQVSEDGGGTAQSTFTITIESGLGDEGAPLEITTTSLPAVETSIYAAILEAKGGTKPYTWTLVSHGGTGFGLSTNGVLSGWPPLPGTYGLTFRVTDAEGVSVQKSLILTVTYSPTPTTPVEPLVIKTDALPDFDTLIYAATLEAEGGRAPYTWTLDDGGGTGLNLTTNGVLHNQTSTPGVYINPPPGVYGLTFRVQDADNRTSIRSLGLLVGDGTTSMTTIITPADLPAATSGQHYAVVLRAAGGGGEYTWSILDEAPGATGLALDPATGVLSGMAPAAGTYDLTIQVVGSDDSADVRIFTLNVN